MDHQINIQFDPLKAIYPLIHDLILQHISPSELFSNLSKVSPYWNESVSQSRFFKNQFKLVIYPHKNGYQDLIEIIGRDYQHVEIKMCSKSISAHHRSYGIFCFKDFNDADRTKWALNAVKILKSQRHSVKTLRIEYLSEKSDEIEFPMLESFVAVHVSADIVKSIVKSTKKLKYLNIKMVDHCQDNMSSSLVKCLEANQNLKDLHLEGSDFINMFKSELNVTFQLEAFNFPYACKKDDYNDIASNFKKFLFKQKATLQTLNFFFPGYEIEKFALESLPALHSLTLCDVYLPEPVITNPSIKLLDIQVMHVDMQETLPYKERYSITPQNQILAAVPNVERIWVTCLDKLFIESLVKKCPKLTQVDVEYVGREDDLDYDLITRQNPEGNSEIDFVDLKVDRSC